MDTLRVLLTNDDGIESPGIGALYEELTEIADVTVVAPAENQSGTGRTRNGAVTVTDHPMGYKVEGTPADCVAFGLGGGLDRAFDVVVSGINDGPNIGNYVVGRSGTVGACIEAAFVDVPAVAVSAYHTEDFFCHPPEEYDFRYPAVITRRLIDGVESSGVFEQVDFLNVNAPVDAQHPRVRLTEFLSDYEPLVEEDADESEVTDDGFEGRTVRLVDKTWPHVAGYENPFPDADDHRDRYPESSDRYALMDGDVSVSPLSISHEYVDSPALERVVSSLARR